MPTTALTLEAALRDDLAAHAATLRVRGVVAHRITLWRDDRTLLRAYPDWADEYERARLVAALAAVARTLGADALVFVADVYYALAPAALLSADPARESALLGVSVEAHHSPRATVLPYGIADDGEIVFRAGEGLDLAAAAGPLVDVVGAALTLGTTPPARADARAALAVLEAAGVAVSLGDDLVEILDGPA